MNKSDIIAAIAGMMESEPFAITTSHMQYFTSNGDPVAMSAQSTHNQNGGEPWKKSNKRRMNK